VACALLSERHLTTSSRHATSCDLLAAADREQEWPPHVRRVARDLEDTARKVLGADSRKDVDEAAFRRAVFSAYPDRIGRRRTPGGDRFLLSSGTGARLGRESGVWSPEFIVAVGVGGVQVRAGSAAHEAVIRLATGIEKEWIVDTVRDVEHEFDAAAGRVRAISRERAGAVIVAEHDIEPDPAVAGPILAAVLRARGPSEADEQLMNRLKVAGVEMTFDALVESACASATRLSEVSLFASVPSGERHVVDRLAPAELALPSGRRARLRYGRDGRVIASVKLQELFGLADSPRIGRAKVPVTFELLSPAGRPVQVTSDLKSFWTAGYPEVRKELRARYPRHPWPDDPWTAKPTHRTVKR
jgi:ATP-dependent helicase HrpB